jgi:predicted nucleic acid-binding Zn finger protein
LILAESFAGGEQPLRAAAVADHVFAEISAAGELSPCAMARLLALYKQGTLEAALGLVVLPFVPRFFALPDMRMVVTPAASGRTNEWCRKSWLRAAGRSTSLRVLGTSHTVLFSSPPTTHALSSDVPARSCVHCSITYTRMFAVCFKHYCPCPYYVMSVLSRPEALACKHILASRIGEALGKIETLGASNEEYICWVHKQVSHVEEGKISIILGCVCKAF